MAWPRLKVFWLSKDAPVRHRERENRRRGGKTIIKSGQEWILPAQLLGGHLKLDNVEKNLWRSYELGRLRNRIVYKRKAKKTVKI